MYGMNYFASLYYIFFFLDVASRKVNAFQERETSK